MLPYFALIHHLLLILRIQLTPSSLLPSFSLQFSPSIYLGERSWWNPTGQPRPTGISTDIVPSDLLALRDVALAANSRIVFSLNFRFANDPSIAVEEARALIEHIGFPSLYVKE
jgi:hypothetical protein